jgi:hypothetical protein
LLLGVLEGFPTDNAKREDPVNDVVLLDGAAIVLRQGKSRILLESDVRRRLRRNGFCRPKSWSEL